jgi:NADH-quinone oxidoreductase subunit C
VTTGLSTVEVVKQVNERCPSAVTGVTDSSIIVDSQRLLDVMTLLKNTPSLDFNYLSAITAIDYFQYFEVVYQLVSMEHNHSLTVKTTCRGRENPRLPSVVSLWRGADLQEREIYDLMGITFDGHPNMKRIVLWPEFQGHPLRKDYL